MGRPSIKAERSAEILDAFEACVVRYGVEGATLQKIADEAGLARPLLRHYVGNKEALVDALVERYIDATNAMMHEVLAMLPAEHRVEQLIDVLFDKEFASSSTDAQLVHAFAIAAQTRPELLDRLRQWYVDFERFLERELESEYEGAEKGDYSVVATGIIGIYHNSDHLGALGGSDKLVLRSKAAAMQLLSTLRIKSSATA